MRLSIVVIFHNMQREAARTLYSLSAAHQQGVSSDDYEIITIDNGSTRPLDPEQVTAIAPNIRYHFHDTTSVSPVGAVNLGAEMAQGDALAVIVDGARMATPGLVRQSLAALRLNRRAFVCALSWHIGPDIQPRTTQDGYDQTREDALLEKANWQADGYQLFAISTIAPSSGCGFLGGFPTECSWFCMGTAAFQALGGFNPAFQSPGGGQCNHDFRNRALSDPDLVPTILLGEGVFHQVHGGTATNAPPDQRPHALFKEEYQRVIGTAFAPVRPRDVVYLGHMPAVAHRFVLPGRA